MNKYLYGMIILIFSNGICKGSLDNKVTKISGEPVNTIGKSNKIGQEATENTAPFTRASNYTDPSRFVKIKVDVQTASNEIDFWIRQISEHALFLHLGIEDASFKKEAMDLHQQFENFRKKFNAGNDKIDFFSSVLPLVQKQRDFQIRLLKALDSGKWIGWIFPLFVNHTTLELDYFIDKVNGIKYSPEAELLFWNRINAEHASFAAHLLDPSERELFLKADKLSTQFKQTPQSEMEMWTRMSLNASKELDAFHKTARSAGKKIQSVIHPALLDHVIREGERSIQTLQSLGLHSESAELKRQYDAQIKQYQQ